MKQTMKRRFTALAVAGLVAIGGAVAATPAQADSTINFGEIHWGGHYHFKKGTQVDGNRHLYNWADLLDKDFGHSTEVAHYNSAGRWIGGAGSGWQRPGVWAKVYRGIGRGTYYYGWFYTR